MNTPNNATDNAMFAQKPEPEEVDGEACFTAPSRPQRLREIVVLSPTAYAARLTAARHAEIVRMVEQQLAEESAAAAQPDRNTSHGFELAFMDEALAALRSGVVEPITRLTDEQMAELEAERVGAEFSETPFLF